MTIVCGGERFLKGVGEFYCLPRVRVWAKDLDIRLQLDDNNSRFIQYSRE